MTGWITETSLCSGNWSPNGSTSSLMDRFPRHLNWAWGLSKCTDRSDGSGAVSEGGESECGVYWVIVITLINTQSEWYDAPVQQSLWSPTPEHQSISHHGTGMCAVEWLTHTDTYALLCIQRAVTWWRNDPEGELWCSDLWHFTSPQSYGTQLSQVTEVNMRSSTNTLPHTLPVALHIQ